MVDNGMNMDYPLAISRSYGKSPLFIGKSKLLSSKNGPLSTARLNNQGETYWRRHILSGKPSDANKRSLGESDVFWLVLGFSKNHNGNSTVSNKSYYKRSYRGKQLISII
jgi:hypothetical protein